METKPVVVVVARCLRCRRPRKGVVACTVGAYVGDSLAVRTALCPGCMEAVRRGRAEVMPMVVEARP